MAWYLIGPNGAIQFKTMLGWMLPEIQAELNSGGAGDIMGKPFPYDLGYHSPVPVYEGQMTTPGECPILNGICYYGGSSLRADDVFNTLVRGGSEALWTYLDGEYEARFGVTLPEPFKSEKVYREFVEERQKLIRRVTF